MATRTLVLSGPVADEDGFIEAMERTCHQLEETHGLKFAYNGVAELSSLVAQHTWADENGRLSARAVRDLQVGALYVDLEAPDLSDEADTFEEVFRAYRSCDDLESVLGALETSSDPATLNRLGLIAREPDNRVIDLLLAGMEDTDRATRLAAVNAMGLLAWIDFVVPLHDRSPREPSPEVRFMIEQGIYLCIQAEKNS